MPNYGPYIREWEMFSFTSSGSQRPSAEQARRTVEAQKQELTRLLNGSRPEEIVQARSTMQALLATMHNTEITYRRDLELRHKQVISQQTLDDAESKYRE